MGMFGVGNIQSPGGHYSAYLGTWYSKFGSGRVVKIGKMGGGTVFDPGELGYLRHYSVFEIL